MKAGFRRLLGILVVGAVLAAVGLSLYGRGQGPQKKGFAGRRDATGPVSVVAATAQTADVPVYLDGVGTTKALNTANVTSLVDGTLLSVDYVEGQSVKQGDVLARVDPVTYQAALDQAIAKKALDEAQLANAKRDLVRYTNLVKTNAIAPQQLDTQKALVSQLEAQVNLDQGAIDNAAAYLKWCTITSPIDGRTGIRLVDKGNVVHAASATTIVVVTQIQPIAMLFTLPQQQLGRINSAIASANTAGAGPLVVEALGGDNKTVVDRGKLQVVNNQVDQTTGTIQLKAEFPNADLQLWPGQFVNVRLLVDTLHDVVTVPSVAVQRGPPPNTNFVYVVQPDNTVSVRAVGVGQQNESQTVITRGLNTGDRVVTTGFTQLADKRSVTIAPAQAAEGAPADPEPTANSEKAANGGQKSGGADKAGGKRRRSSDAAPSATP
ncbi:MAG: efflux RND transporter periplasmic adaptor subunit [Hyphomicrobiales bacterium]|nr:efflux RND transporter periplasmic adaptor subunit [Hyphomicrobiales bacterium]MBV8823650.1 efflux RND transporter periplasmic adaptor subunit [Hyphomicrobiales bacterium]